MMQPDLRLQRDMVFFPVWDKRLTLLLARHFSGVGPLTPRHFNGPMPDAEHVSLFGLSKYQLARCGTLHAGEFIASIVTISSNDCVPSRGPSRSERPA